MWMTEGRCRQEADMTAWIINAMPMRDHLIESDEINPLKRRIEKAPDFTMGLTDWLKLTGDIKKGA
jgi:hypothetical protein